MWICEIQIVAVTVTFYCYIANTEHLEMASIEYGKEFRCKFKYHDIKSYKSSPVNTQCANSETGMYSPWFNTIHCTRLFLTAERNNSFLENYVDSFCNPRISSTCTGKLSKRTFPRKTHQLSWLLQYVCWIMSCLQIAGGLHGNRHP